MKNTFNQRLKELSLLKKSKLCIGLDIDPDKMPNTMDKSISGIESYIKELIEATTDLCVAYKLNMAFYEQFGSKGYELMEKIVEYIDGRNITIADGKRGDIGNTTKKYAISIFDAIGFDSITVSPYMGSDSILPFSQNKNKGVYVLCLTSNPSANEIQLFNKNGMLLFEFISNLVSKLNENNNIGLVVGATKPEFMNKIRMLNSVPWLIPGIGAQGGDLKQSVTISNSNNSIGIINVSRAVIFAGDCNLNEVNNAAKSYNKQINEIDLNE
tara:strand:+ start:886 stop:1695 length:810 start_codon:yes stop_codon:yes gene_type:complete